MSENTDKDVAARRLQEERERRVAEIRQALDKGGSDEVSKRLGKSALGSDEFKVAQRQRQAAQARRREAAEERARQSKQQTQRSGQGPMRTRQEMVDAQKKFVQSSRSPERARERVQQQSQSR